MFCRWMKVDVVEQVGLLAYLDSKVVRVGARGV